MNDYYKHKEEGSLNLICCRWEWEHIILSAHRHTHVHMSKHIHIQERIPHWLIDLDKQSIIHFEGFFVDILNLVVEIMS